MRSHPPSAPVLALLAGLLSLPSWLDAQSPAPPVLPPGTVQVQGDSAAWTAGPPTLPAGTQIMVLEGNPAQQGFFTMRVWIPAGARLQPHSHPQDERVTIFSGLVRVGFGETFDEARMASFGPGSFYINPAGSRHYVWVVEETVMQITGMGPWEIHYPEARQ
jgi:quercetin dioxygenase-like cupin family protein